VGFSPTFVGRENREKVVEAHLILDSSATAATAAVSRAGGDGASQGSLFVGDFYGCYMRLALVGQLRPELRFPTFPALVEQIHQVA
jgi:hypothetical protein